jgi:hypothetical protein
VRRWRQQGAVGQLVSQSKGHYKAHWQAGAGYSSGTHAWTPGSSKSCSACCTAGIPFCPPQPGSLAPSHVRECIALCVGMHYRCGSWVQLKCGGMPVCKTTRHPGVAAADVSVTDTRCLRWWGCDRRVIQAGEGQKGAVQTATIDMSDQQTCDS